MLTLQEMIAALEQGEVQEVLATLKALATPPLPQSSFSKPRGQHEFENPGKFQQGPRK